MPTAPVPIPEWPVPPPTSTNPDDFDAAADATWEAAPSIVTATNDLGENVYQNALEAFEAASDIAASAAVAVDAAGLRGDSTTTLTVGAGSKAITLTAAKPSLMTAGRQVVLVLKSDASIKMYGNIEAAPAPTSTTATVTVTSGGVFGSGTYSSWHVIDAAFFGSDATSPEIWAGETAAAAISPHGLVEASEFQALTDAPTVSWDTNTQGFNAKVTLTANRIIGAPTNLKDGVTYALNIIGAFTPSFNAIFDFGLQGTPSFGGTAGSVTKVTGQYDSVRGKLDCGWRRTA